MAIINTNGGFGSTDTVTNTNLNAVADAATFNDPVDEATLELITTGADSGKLRIKAGGVDTNQIASNAVNFSKLTDVNDDDTMSNASATTLATSESIKAYVDGMRPKFVALAGGTIDLAKTTSSVSTVDYTYNIADFTSADSDFATNKIVALIVESFTSSGANLNKVLVRLPNDDFTTIGSTSADSTADFTQDNGSFYLPINSGQS